MGSRKFSAYDLNRIWSKEERDTLSDRDFTKLALFKAWVGTRYFVVVGLVVAWLAPYFGILGKIVGWAHILLFGFLTAEPLMTLILTSVMLVAPKSASGLRSKLWLLAQMAITVVRGLIMAMLIYVLYKRV